MAGKKGRSGRRPRSLEQKRLDDIDKCWDVMMEFVNSDAPLKERAELASKVVVRAIPEQHEHSGNININKVMFND